VLAQLETLRGGVPFLTTKRSVREQKFFMTAFDAGDIAWILTCTALVWLMM
jgi:hypothetical protein